MTEPRLDRVIHATGPGGLSALIALRALAAADDGAHAVDRARWMTDVREEYHRWYGGSNGQAPGNFADAETVRYLDEQVVRQLVTAGVVEFLADPEGEPVEPVDGGWQAVRLAPWVLNEVAGRRAEVLDHMDQRIRAILSDTGPAAASTQAAPAAEYAGAASTLAAAYAAEGGAETDVASGSELALSEHDPEAPHPQRRRSMLVEGGLTLSAKGLVKSYRGRRVVNDVDVHVSQGEIVGLLGPNGAGKTTSFYMITGLIRPDRGKVFIGQRDLTGVPMYRRARAGIGYLAQEPSIFRRLTVEENVLAILQMMKLSRAEQKRRLEELLDELGIKHLRKTRAYALSGGERRRLEITRALVSQPRFMLLDEPFAGVDPIAVHDIQQIVSDLRRRGIGVLISDHNVEQTLDIVDRAYIMYEGRVRVSGTVSELVWNDEVAEIYLGPTLTARMRERYQHPESEDAV
ncbi:MAG TPA: LPS export ABC transporter ATP-binding protein [Longimicrobium sp.]|nr:LPS export ABC transporter ATP-binding protein [Longimicrobium sp.]